MIPNTLCLIEDELDVYAPRPTGAAFPAGGAAIQKSTATAAH